MEFLISVMLSGNKQKSDTRIFSSYRFFVCQETATQLSCPFAEKQTIANGATRLDENKSALCAFCSYDIGLTLGQLSPIQF